MNCRGILQGILDTDNNIISPANPDCGSEIIAVVSYSTSGLSRDEFPLPFIGLKVEQFCTSHKGFRLKDRKNRKRFRAVDIGSQLYNSYHQ